MAMARPKAPSSIAVEAPSCRVGWQQWWLHPAQLHFLLELHHAARHGVEQQAHALRAPADGGGQDAEAGVPQRKPKGHLRELRTCLSIVGAATPARQGVEGCHGGRGRAVEGSSSRVKL